MILHHGNCIEILRMLESNSVDSLVTDPPAGIGFMNKEWDSNKGGSKQWINWMAEVMKECHRVLKPGAHGLVWALPRTSHWTAMACEWAGFEIRDVITHLFGQGFPKSLDISKAIDKAAGNERIKVPIVDLRTGKIKTQNIKGGMLKGGRKEFIGISNEGIDDSAKEWQGWGTALKPASEHWILIRKSISEKTVAANVLKYGTGGLNIDSCRVPSSEKVIHPIKVSTNKHDGYRRPWNSDIDAIERANKQKIVAAENCNNIGRFPANLVLSHTEHCTDKQCDLECAVKMLDGQSGILKQGGFQKGSIKKSNPEKVSQHSHISNILKKEGVVPQRIETDTYGASRFFYCAKISPKERGEGNNHPTVKPQKLMRYLVKMITPPNGMILDPFMGSGSTGMAAKSEGFHFIGIEKEKEYFDITEKRISKIERIK